MVDNEVDSARERWARLRFSIGGPLLAAPPGPGELREALTWLSEKSWRHPITGAPVRFGASTIERWYYSALNAKHDPVGALRPRLRQDTGKPRRLSEAAPPGLTDPISGPPGLLL